MGQSTLERLTAGYIKFKESPWALTITIGFCIVWVALREILRHFDQDFAWYQVILSTDASVVMTLFAMDSARQHAHQIRVERRTDLMLRSILDLLKAKESEPCSSEPTAKP